MRGPDQQILNAKTNSRFVDLNNVGMRSERHKTMGQETGTGAENRDCRFVDGHGGGVGFPSATGHRVLRRVAVNFRSRARLRVRSFLCKSTRFERSPRQRLKILVAYEIFRPSRNLGARKCFAREAWRGQTRADPSTGDITPGMHRTGTEADRFDSFCRNLHLVPPNSIASLELPAVLNRRVLWHWAN